MNTPNDAATATTRTGGSARDGRRRRRDCATERRRIRRRDHDEAATATAATTGVDAGVLSLIAEEGSAGSRLRALPAAVVVRRTAGRAPRGELAFLTVRVCSVDVRVSCTGSGPAL